MKKKPTQSRGGVKGGSPLRGQGAELPCGVWGNAPTVPRATSMPNVLNKGAGSEASLPVTLRFLRSAPQAALSPNYAVSRQMGATELLVFPTIAALFCKRGISPLRRRQGGFAVAPLTPSQCTPMLLDFHCCRGNRRCGGDQRAFRSPFGNLRRRNFWGCLRLEFVVAGDFAPAGATRGLCGRPLDPFAADTPILDFYCKFFSLCT